MPLLNRHEIGQLSRLIRTSGPAGHPHRDAWMQSSSLRCYAVAVHAPEDSELRLEAEMALRYATHRAWNAHWVPDGADPATFTFPDAARIASRNLRRWVDAVRAEHDVSSGVTNAAGEDITARLLTDTRSSAPHDHTRLNGPDGLPHIDHLLFVLGEVQTSGATSELPRSFTPMLAQLVHVQERRLGNKIPDLDPMEKRYVERLVGKLQGYIDPPGDATDRIVVEIHRSAALHVLSATMTPFLAEQRVASRPIVPTAALDELQSLPDRYGELAKAIDANVAAELEQIRTSERAPRPEARRLAQFTPASTIYVKNLFGDGPVYVPPPRAPVPPSL